MKSKFLNPISVPSFVYHPNHNINHHHHHRRYQQHHHHRRDQVQKLEGQSGVDSKLQGIRTLDSQPKFFLHLRARDHGDDNDHNDDDHYDDDEDDGADHYNGDAHDARRELDRGMNMMIVHVMEVMMVIMVMMMVLQHIPTSQNPTMVGSWQ